ncbi:MAG: hypothetical protein HY423_09525 [Candidatus Lambdaproteobacteria bacterium]|nr:hypothetical protein [Candidatus Lambdaproteobacteria bacterium]
MSQFETIDVQLEMTLLKRIDDLVDELQMSREEFIVKAIDNELRWQEMQMLKDEISTQELQKMLFQSGQSLMPTLAEEAQVAGPDLHECELCLRVFGKPLAAVKGPVLCDECLQTARGGDFGPLYSRS